MMYEPRGLKLSLRDKFDAVRAQLQYVWTFGSEDSYIPLEETRRDQKMRASIVQARKQILSIPRDKKPDEPLHFSDQNLVELLRPMDAFEEPHRVLHLLQILARDSAFLSLLPQEERFRLISIILDKTNELIRSVDVSPRDLADVELIKGYSDYIDGVRTKIKPTTLNVVQLLAARYGFLWDNGTSEFTLHVQKRE